MKLTLTSTDKVVELRVDGALVPARVWEGESEAGVKCHAFITRVSVALGQPEEVYAEFERDLHDHQKCSPEIEAIPLRFII